MNSNTNKKNQKTTITNTQQLHNTFINQKQSPNKYQHLNHTKLITNTIKFNYYHISNNNNNHHKTITQTLTQNYNLINTSTNYNDNSNKQLINHVINSIQTTTTHKQLIIISKTKYIQNSNLTTTHDLHNKNQNYTKIIEYNEHY